MNLPNRLTIFRIVLIPVIILVYLFPYASFGIEPSVFTIGNTSISIVNIIDHLVYFHYTHVENRLISLFWRDNR